MLDTTSSRPTRRAFLVGSLALLAAGCNDSEGAADPGSSGGSSAPDSPTSSTTPSSAAPPGTSASTATSLSPSEPSTTGVALDEPPIASLTPAAFESLTVCALTPESAAGPFPSKEPLDRSDIDEGYPGHPLRLGIRVVDADCLPIGGAAVEIWHTDASGDYSEYADGGSGKDEGDGTTFCRGWQSADAEGIVEFQTIYPGWYGGRAVHIHVIVYVEGQPTLTAQVYFDESYTEQVYSTGEYEQFGPPDTTWARDRLAGDPTDDGTAIALTAAETKLGPGTLGLINLGV